MMAALHSGTGYSAERIPCAECGKMFLPKRDSNIFCSKSCGQRHRYRVKSLRTNRTEVFACQHNSGVCCMDADCARCGFYPPVDRRRKAEIMRAMGIQEVAE